MRAATTLTVARREHCKGHSLRDVMLLRRAGASYAGAMVFKLKDKSFLRLRSARGTAIEVVDGRVWITEDGHQRDRFLSAGGRYQVCGDGLVLVGAECDETNLRLLA